MRLCFVPRRSYIQEKCSYLTSNYKEYKPQILIDTETIGYTCHTYMYKYVKSLILRYRPKSLRRLSGSTFHQLKT